MSPGPHSIPNMLGPKAGLSYAGLRFLIMRHENKRSLVIFFFLVGVGGVWRHQNLFSKVA